MKRKKVILVSLDALSSTDMKYVRQLPNFSRIIKEGAYCPKVYSVYPSLTFPSHASIATGCLPSSHGVVNNYLFAPFEKIPKWNFYASNLKRKAIWDYAREGGKRVLSMSWPVSAGANMAYSMPEMSPAKPKIWNMGNFFRQLGVLRRYGTPSFGIKTLLSSKELPKSWFLGKQPQLDICMMNCFLKAVKELDYDIALLHIYGMDDAKHGSGADSKESRSYLRLYDRFIGQLMNYSEKADQETALMFMGDHSQKDVTFAIHGNHILEEMGLSVYQKGKLISYEAFLDSCDGMAYIYIHNEVKEPGRRQMAEKIALRFSGITGVKKVMKPEEFKNLGCDKTADLVLEAEEGYSFETGYEEEAFRREDATVFSHYKGLHGYLPDLMDYQTMFFCWGRDVNPLEIKEMSIIDVLPTICRYLKLSSEQAEGRAIEGIWKPEDGGEG